MAALGKPRFAALAVLAASIASTPTAAPAPPPSLSAFLAPTVNASSTAASPVGDFNGTNGTMANATGNRSRAARHGGHHRGTSPSAAPKCASLDAPENSMCKEVVEWGAARGKYDPAASTWYADMVGITGVNYTAGDAGDFQRLYFCAPPGGKACGLPPCTCSKPPCDSCFGSEAAQESGRASCPAGSPISCGPPKTPFGYKGRSWPTMTFHGEGEMHIFSIGDWGGMDGSLNPVEGRTPLVSYEWGKVAGPSVFPRSRWNKMHDEELCSHKQFVQCFNTRGTSCEEGCGYVEGVDDHPQLLVASALRARAAEKDPQYLLNVGDNFYWGGIEKTCGTPMGEISYTARHQFDQVYEQVYQGAGLSNKPWLSVLGNHDWGGFKFSNGWDQQIAYTWYNKRWVMPAPYWHQRVEYPDQNMSVDLYFLDSNFVDAMDPEEDPNHNICSAKNNAPDVSCEVADGPASVEDCPQFFKDLWAEQQTWLEGLLPKSNATWQIVVTHFPCGHEQEWYKKLYEDMGLDLLVTGHRHDQELWLPDDTARNHMGGLTCFVTGGGGGITSEASPNSTNTSEWYGEGQYGFYDLTIRRTEILIESINYDGRVLLNATVLPNK